MERDETGDIVDEDGQVLLTAGGDVAAAGAGDAAAAGAAAGAGDADVAGAGACIVSLCTVNFVLSCVCLAGETAGE